MGARGLSLPKITAVLWKWKPAPGYRSKFEGRHVDISARMLKRHYPGEMEVVCITDDPEGITQADRIIPLWDDFSNMKSPHDRPGRSPNPSCYRRLKMFAPDAADWLGERILSIDLDTVITGDLTRPLSRKEDFVIWGDTSPNTYYNGGLILFTAGCRPQLWTEFDPVTSPVRARQAQQWGSDQAWIGACLGPKEAKFGTSDGVYSYRNHLKNPTRGSCWLPNNAKIISFHGAIDPDHPEPQRLPWVKRYYQ